MSTERLPSPFGERIDRKRPVEFSFNGRIYHGYHGDTLASALLANRVRLVARSFKLHRPRGIYSSGVEEPNAIVDVGPRGHHSPNVRATMLEIFDGLETRSVNAWPSVGLDFRAANGWFSRVLPAGFYYKTFMWPKWQLFEPWIRRAAGLGEAPTHVDTDRYEELAADTPLLIVGGGIAGLTAAIAAAEAGMPVLLLSSAPAFGGAANLTQLSAKLIQRAGELPIQMLLRTTAFGIYDHNLVCACQTLPNNEDKYRSAGNLRARLWKIRARNIVLATGALERPMIFPDNDRPGVMLAGAAERYARYYGVLCGQRAVITANDDHAYQAAASLHRAGMQIALIADCRSDDQIGADRRLLDGIRAQSCTTITAVHGSHAVRGCTVTAGGHARRVNCDLILSAGGFIPTVHLHSPAGGKLRWAADAAMFVPDGAASQSITSVGACAGVFSQAAALEHARQVGSTVARGSAPPQPTSPSMISLASTHKSISNSKQFVDLQNDVTADDVALAARENYRSVEHLKRYTTLGMGTDQGKTSNVNGLVLMGTNTGRDPPKVGTTRFRPPYAPVALGVFSGRRIGGLYKPTKQLPAESWHRERGALFEEYAGWMRPAAYLRPGEMLQAAALREAKHVREAVGLFDGTPLGKIEVFGSDAAAFLDLMYLGAVSTLAVGQARYGMLLSENGVIVDDGIVARMAEDHFWINTTSAGVERTAAAFEEWLQCEFVNMKVAVTPVTSCWSNVTIAGPGAWDWLHAAGLPQQLAPTHFEHMRFTTVTIDAAPVRVLRASFTGELGYELNVPTGKVGGLLDRLWSKADRFNAVAYGVEALQIMRTEKGYIHVGTDTDGTTLPGDIGMGKGIKSRAVHFVGRRSLSLPVALDADRLQLIGLESSDPSTVLPVGAHIASTPPPARSLGYVTSSTWSPALGRPIALAMLSRGRARMGERVKLYHMESAFEATVVRTAFLDPKGNRHGGH